MLTPSVSPAHLNLNGPYIKPVEHPQYHWEGKPEENDMTIAAGFLYRGGALLCADTQMTIPGSSITHERKIFSIDCPWGTVVMGYAGCSPFALSTIQKCERCLIKTTPAKALGEVGRIIDEEYRRLVFEHPEDGRDDSDFSLLFALSAGGKVSLYSTSEVAVHRVDRSYECVGSGRDLACYLIGGSLEPDMGERRALAAAAFTLSCVKGNVDGCGGHSQFVYLRDNGDTREFWSMASKGWPPSHHTEWLERHSQGYEAYARRLFFNIANPDITDADFERHANTFRSEILKLRQDWRSKTHVHESFNDLLMQRPKMRSLDDEPNQKSPKRGRKRRKPSQE